jgi:hypothetical protein
MTLAAVAAWESVAAAAVTALTAAGVAIWQGSKTRQTNSQEHGDTTRHLLDLHHKVDRVVDKLDEHIQEHRHDL